MSRNRSYGYFEKYSGDWSKEGPSSRGRTDTPNQLLEKEGNNVPHQYFLIKNNVVVSKFPSHTTVEKSVCSIHFHKELFKC